LNSKHTKAFINNKDQFHNNINVLFYSLCHDGTGGR